jgi:hypothetical protein
MRKTWCIECGGWGEWIELKKDTSRMVCCPECLGAGLVPVSQTEIDYRRNRERQRDAALEILRRARWRTRRH